MIVTVLFAAVSGIADGVKFFGGNFSERRKEIRFPAVPVSACIIQLFCFFAVKLADKLGMLRAYSYQKESAARPDSHKKLIV